MNAGFWIVSLVVAIVCMVVAGNLFVKKGRSKTVGMLLGFFLGLIGLIIALVIPAKNAPAAMS